jgi:hypothetical protein
VAGAQACEGAVSSAMANRLRVLWDMASLVEQRRRRAIAVGLAERGCAAKEGERLSSVAPQTVVGEFAEVEGRDGRTGVGG